jgi:hypothetical protein
MYVDGAVGLVGCDRTVACCVPQPPRASDTAASITPAEILIMSMIYQFGDQEADTA